MTKKYVIFKDDDVGVDTPKLKRWIEIVIKNDAKATVGLIGKYMKDEELISYLNSLDNSKIEIFCHGYHHKHYPYIIRNITKSKDLPKTEFNKDIEKHNSSLKKYRTHEANLLHSKTITFGPQGNIWNKDVIIPLLEHDFKMMFSWENVGGGILTIPLSGNLEHESLKDFIKCYEEHENDVIYTLQFHHAKYTDKNFEVMEQVIDYLKNKERRVFVTPSDLFSISQNNKEVYSIMSK